MHACTAGGLFTSIRGAAGELTTAMAAILGGLIVPNFLIVSCITQCLHASTRWQASVKAWQLHLSPILQAAVCNTTQAAAAAGTVEVDAHTTMLSLFGLLITLTAWGIGCASTIRIGNLLGAGHVQQARLSGEQPWALPAKQPA